MRISTPLAVSALAAAAATIVLTGARLAGPDDLDAASPEAMLPTLMAWAALCVVALTIRRSPSAAWLATIAALSIATIDIAAFARTAQGSLDVDAWRWLSIVLCVAAGFATSAAVTYAAERGRRLGRWVLPVGGAAVIFLLAVSLAALAAPGGPAFVDPDSEVGPTLGTLNLVTRTFLVVVASFTTLGIAGDAQPAARRASRRAAAGAPRSPAAGSRAGQAAAWVTAFVDELAPGRTRARQAAVAERSRIARELHAEVVPAIRQALVDAERDESPERLAASLREVLGVVDSLVDSRHSVVLEVGGLIAAVEWLAERVEDRSDVRVTINVGESASGSGARPPEPVAAAAYRVAELALDNVARHAAHASVCIDIVAEPALVVLTIADDGPGIDDDTERAASQAGRRGLVDMRAEASSVDASLRITTREGGSGVVVRFRWPSA